MNQKDSKFPNRQQLLRKAFNFLKVRDRTEFELRLKLAETDAGNEDIEAVIQELNEMGFIDDGEFAQKFARFRLITKHQGPVRIKLELKKLGVADSIITETINQLPQHDTVSAAVSYLESRSWRLRKYDEREQQLKAKQLLFARGFGSETISLAIDEFFTQE